MQTLTLTCDQANSSLNSGRTSDYYGCLTGKTWENRTHVGSSSRKEFDCVSGEFSGWRSSTRLARCWAWRISFWLWTRQIFAEFWWLQAAMSYGVKRCLVLRTWAGTVAPWRSGYLQGDQCRCSGQCQHALEPSIDRPPHLPGFFVGIFELHCDSSDFQPTTHRHSAFDSTDATGDERHKITCWFCVEAEEIAGDYATTMPQDSFLRMSKQFWDPAGGLLWWLSLRYADCMMSLQIAVVPQVQHGNCQLFPSFWICWDVQGFPAFSDTLALLGLRVNDLLPIWQDFVPLFDESQVLGRAILIPAACLHLLTLCNANRHRFLRRNFRLTWQLRSQSQMRLKTCRQGSRLTIVMRCESFIFDFVKSDFGIWFRSGLQSKTEEACENHDIHLHFDSVAFGSLRCRPGEDHNRFCERRQYSTHAFGSCTAGKCTVNHHWAWQIQLWS